MIYSVGSKPRRKTNASLSLRIHPASRFDETRFENVEDVPLNCSVDTFETDPLEPGQFDASQFNLELAEHILKRIEARLPGRIRHLTVYTTENAVVLAGQCSTFYSKQLAQHAAMGVLEYEQLINNIDVRVAK